MNYLYEVERGASFTNIPRLLTILIHNSMGKWKKYSGQQLING